LFGKRVDERIILPIGDVVEVLYADNRRDRLRLGDLLGADGTYPEVLYQTLFLHFSEHAELLRYRTWLRCIEATYSQINRIECVETEIHEVVMNGSAELVWSERFEPISFRIPSRANLGDDP